MVSVHPPTHKPIKVFANEKIVHTFPYKSGLQRVDTDTLPLGDIEMVHEQANYTNAVLSTIAEQLSQFNAKTTKKDMEALVQNLLPLHNAFQNHLSNYTVFLLSLIHI